MDTTDLHQSAQTWSKHQQDVAWETYKGNLNTGWTLEKHNGGTVWAKVGYVPTNPEWAGLVGWLGVIALLTVPALLIKLFMP